MGKNQTSFTIGNQAHLIYDLEEAKRVYEEIFNYALQNSSLSIQEAVFGAGYRPSQYYYLGSKFAVLDPVKKDLADLIISIINEKALNGDFNATASIWRFKQLGEKDKTEKVNINKNFDIPIIDFVDED